MTLKLPFSALHLVTVKINFGFDYIQEMYKEFVLLLSQLSIVLLEVADCIFSNVTRLLS